MARKLFHAGLVLALAVAVLAGVASAQSGCTTAIISLAPCLNYITGNSSMPSSSCCTQLSSVVQSNPACLCALLNGAGSSYGININQTRALAMPAACRVQTPPVSECNATSPEKSPVGSPEPPATPATPANPTPETPSTTSTPSAGAQSGSKATPATSTTSDGASFKSTHSAMLSIVFLAAACISFFTKL